MQRHEVVVYTPVQALVMDLLTTIVWGIPLAGWMALGIVLLCIGAAFNGRWQQYKRSQKLRRARTQWHQGE